MDKAKELLASPERRTFSAISAACGFRDLRRFRLVFHRFEGVTPAHYRRSLNEASGVPPRLSNSGFMCS